MGLRLIGSVFFFFGYHTDKMDPLTVDSFDPPFDTETVHVKDALCGLPTSIDPNWQKEEQSWRVIGNYPNGSFGQRLNGHIPSGVGDRDAIRRLSGRNEVSGFFGYSTYSRSSRQIRQDRVRRIRLHLKVVSARP